MESPFGKTFRIDDIEALSERQLEKLFHLTICLLSFLSKQCVNGMLEFMQSRIEPEFFAILEHNTYLTGFSRA